MCQVSILPRCPTHSQFPQPPSYACWRACLSTPSVPLDRELCTNILPFLFLTGSQIIRASTTGPGATTTSFHKDRLPLRPRRQWTYPLCHHLGLRGRPWEVWTTRCLATTLPVRRSDSLTSWHIPQGTRQVLNPACPGLSTPCQLRSSGLVHPSLLCRSTGEPATGTTCPILLK